MNTVQLRADELGIDIKDTAFDIFDKDLLEAIADEVDFETVTNHELREIFSIVRKQLQHLNWRQLVAHSIRHLPFGLNQTGIAWEGHYPCSNCPDAMLEEQRCYHKNQCKAWEIYEAHL
jgi:hypothetical protein